MRRQTSRKEDIKRGCLEVGKGGVKEAGKEERICKERREEGDNDGGTEGKRKRQETG